jgi:hypothetical protein
MSIQFSCDQCGHAIDVDDHLAGKHGVCKHCGHALVVPARTGTAVDAAGPLRLRPLDVREPAGPHAHLLDAHAPLIIRPATAEPHVKPVAISEPHEPGAPSSGDYVLHKPGKERHSAAGPPPFWTNAPTLLAREIARRLRGLRDAIYLLSLGALVLALIGFLFQIKGLLHVGVVVAIAANVSMLMVGIAYLVTLPFKEGMGYGLANLLIPFYAVYYWWTRWPKMKPAVLKTLGAFLPIALATLAFFGYEDGPKLVEAGKREAPLLEKKLEEEVKRLEVGPVKQIEEKVEGAVATPDDATKERAR